MMKSTFIGCIMGAFFATCATAADVPQKAPSTYVAPVAELFQGWWLGAGVGYGWGNVNPDLPISDFKTDGFVGGGSVGYRAQIMRQIYLGVDGTLNFSDMNDSQSFGKTNVKVKNNYFGTAGMSLGYAVLPNLLVSGTAGIAYAEHEATISGFGKAKDTQAGWYVGASADYALANAGMPGWTLGLDYKHIDYGNANFGFPIGFAGITIGTKASVTDDVVMLTGKYRFGL